MNDEQLVKITPSPRQLSFQQLEFYSFIHFTINTMTDCEWGNGKEDITKFHPEKLDAEQWVKAILQAGMKGLILTCKHHDGFCLWPSKYTEHTVAYTPYKGGKGDIVKEVALACKKYGIKFGVYLSPWDRNSELYGSGKAYDDFFIHQLEELLTNYGEVFSVWFDGACGEGPNGKKQYYDWERYYNIVRKLQPNACISVCGPDIRWCGNEAGHTRKAEWSVVPKRAKDSEIIAEKSQHEDDTSFRERRVDARDADLGSREVLAEESELIWYPAEVNTSIRPGWFYHKSEDDRVRSPEELFQIYLNSVGGNATFLLNIPPTPEGLLHENDIKCLQELGSRIEKTFRVGLLNQADILTNGQHKEALCIDDYDTSFIGLKGEETMIDMQWKNVVPLGAIVMKENIKFGQRIEKFSVEAWVDGTMKTLYEGTVVGYKKIIAGLNVDTDYVRIKISDSRCEPILSFLECYQMI